MRLDGIEVKVSLDNSSGLDAIGALGLTEAGNERDIYFLEDSTVGTSLPLFNQGVVLRVRRIDDDADDSTVKLRPCRRSQLRDDWLRTDGHDGWELKLEEDWAAGRHVLAASCVASLPAGRIRAVRDGHEPIRRLFNKAQEHFLSDCVGIPVSLDALTLLPAITATKWTNVNLGQARGVVVERWAVNDLDFLELSMRTDTAADASAAQAVLEDEVIRRNLRRADETESKTTRVLQQLVSGASAQ